VLILVSLFALALSILLTIVYLGTNYYSQVDSSELSSSFECGFDPLRENRSPFSVRFFLLVVLFLIFDVEVALLFPLLSVTCQHGAFVIMSVAMLFFLLILTLGTFHEWKEGALDWVIDSIGQLSLSCWAHNPKMVHPLLMNFVMINLWMSNNSRMVVISK